MAKSNTVLIIKTTYDFMPLGMGYLLSMLEQNNINFDFWDMLRPTKPEKYYLENHRNGKYFLVGTGGFVFNLNDFIKVTKKLKKNNSDVPVILGGNITRNIRPEKLFKYLDVDFVYLGEVEASFVDLIKRMISKQNLVDIPGIAYIDKETSKLVRNGQARVDLAKVNVMPAYKYLDVKHYITTNKHIRFQKLGRVMPMLTGRGCTGGCSFCSPTVGKFVAPSMQNTMREIKYLVENYDFDAFHFITEIFFEFPHEIEDFCREYKKLKINKKWFCCISPHMSPKVYPIMKDAGCVGFNMGLESGSDRILSKTKLGCTVKNFAYLYKEAVKNNLYVDVSYMVANENETKEDMRATFDTLIDNRMQQESFGIVSAYPGTSIYAKAYKKGRIKNELKYLKNVLSSRYWRTYNIKEFKYLNISSIPDNELISTIMSEVQRYYTHLRNAFKAKYQRLYDSKGLKINSIKDFVKSNDEKITFKGRCVDCNNPITKNCEKTFRDGFFEITEVCEKCFTRNFFHLEIINDFKDYFKNLKLKISKGKDILLLGRGKQCEDLLFYNILNLKTEKIHCLIDERTKNQESNGVEEFSKSKKKYFYQLKRLNIEQLSKLQFDLILTGNLIPEQLNPLLSKKDISKVAFLNPLTNKNKLVGYEKLASQQYDPSSIEKFRLKMIDYLNPNIVSYIRKVKKSTKESFRFLKIF